MSLTDTSRFISLILRHKPETIGVCLDEHGWAKVDEQGLLPKSRLYVHLSGDYDTAVKVGSRHGKPVVYEVNTRQMQAEGYVFYQSVNGVWLTKHVPMQYLKTVIENEQTCG